MSSCCRAMNHDASEPSTLNMCNAILNYTVPATVPAKSKSSHSISMKALLSSSNFWASCYAKWTVHHFFCSTNIHTKWHAAIENHYLSTFHMLSPGWNHPCIWHTNQTNCCRTGHLHQSQRGPFRETPTEQRCWPPFFFWVPRLGFGSWEHAAKLGDFVKLASCIAIYGGTWHVTVQ